MNALKLKANFPLLTLRHNESVCLFNEKDHLEVIHLARCVVLDAIPTLYEMRKGLNHHQLHYDTLLR